MNYFQKNLVYRIVSLTKENLNEFISPQRLYTTLVIMMYANLTGQKLEKVQQLEKELGVYLLAAPHYKNLTPDDMKAVKDLEGKLGAVLVAYEA